MIHIEHIQNQNSVLIIGSLYRMGSKNRRIQHEPTEQTYYELIEWMTPRSSFYEFIWLNHHRLLFLLLSWSFQSVYLNFTIIPNAAFESCFRIYEISLFWVEFSKAKGKHLLGPIFADSWIYYLQWFQWILIPWLALVCFFFKYHDVFFPFVWVIRTLFSIEMN